MSARVLRVLLVALVGGITVWGLVTLISPSRQARTSGAFLPLADFMGLPRGEYITAVIISGPDDTVKIEPANSGTRSWFVNGYRADSAAVSRLWISLDEALVGRVVAVNPANHGRMGLTSESASRVDIEVGGIRESVLVGHGGPPQGMTYLRRPDQDTVHVLQGNPGLRLVASLDVWRDRRILALDTAEVFRIVVQRDGSGYRIHRDGGVWMVVDEIEADPLSVRTILAELHNLRSVGFLHPGDPVASRTHRGTVVALGETGDTLAELTFGAREGDHHWARSRGDSTIYRFGYWRVERIAPIREQIITNRSPGQR